jgi:hypothetical protein
MVDVHVAYKDPFVLSRQCDSSLDKNHAKLTQLSLLVSFARALRCLFHVRAVQQLEHDTATFPFTTIDTRIAQLQAR